jgi:hypothetical protein
MMIKYADAGIPGMDCPVAHMVKVATGGLGPVDRRSFLKRASHDFIAHLDELLPGEVPVHLIALGATEAVGANRNGDGFKSATCRAKHDTFVKKAKVYFNHANKVASCPRQGRVIASAFNEDMRRVELLVGLNGTKEAAERDHPELGRVATTWLEKMASGVDPSVSMACLIDHDVCQFCHNKAKTRDDYCDIMPVKLASGRTIPACSGFGCRNGLTKVASDGRMQFVDNPDPLTWFDISEVDRPACRIAYSLGPVPR